MTPGERLQAIRERVEKATPGPWKRRAHVDDHDRPWQQDVVHVENGYPFRLAELKGWDNHEADAEFIGNAREDVPWLLDLVQRLTAERDQARAKAARLREALEIVAETQPEPTYIGAMVWRDLTVQLLSETADIAAWLAEHDRKVKLEGALELERRIAKHRYWRVKSIRVERAEEAIMDTLMNYERELQEGVPDLMGRLRLSLGMSEAHESPDAEEATAKMSGRELQEGGNV